MVKIPRLNPRVKTLRNKIGRAYGTGSFFCCWFELSCYLFKDLKSYNLKLYTCLNPETSWQILIIKSTFKLFLL